MVCTANEKHYKINLAPNELSPGRYGWDHSASVGRSLGPIALQGEGVLVLATLFDAAFDEKVSNDEEVSNIETYFPASFSRKASTPNIQ